MADDEKGDPLLTWAELPRHARMIVYQALREEAAKMSKNTAMSLLMNEVAGGKTNGSVLATAHDVAADAFFAALDELEAIDPSFCQHCGEFHDENEPPKHPKDLS